MCNPYIDDIFARLLQQHDAVRSARLIFLENEAETPFKDSVGQNVTPHRQDFESNRFTVNKFAAKTIEILDEIDFALRAASCWNGQTSADIKAEFLEMYGESEQYRHGLLKETMRLAEIAKRNGIDLSDNSRIAIENRKARFDTIESYSSQRPVPSDIQRFIDDALLAVQ